MEKLSEDIVKVNFECYMSSVSLLKPPLATFITIIFHLKERKPLSLLEIPFLKVAAKTSEMDLAGSQNR